MQIKILIFFAAVRLGLWLMSLFPGSIVSRVAFSWVGPFPTAGERIASFQFRWAIFSFGWLCQCALILCFFAYIPEHWPNTKYEDWLMVCLFALGVGCSMAALACMGFTFKGLKAHFFGPNPMCQQPKDAAQD